MTSFFGRLLKAYAALAAFGMTLLLLVIAALLLSGALNRQRVRESFEVLRGRAPAPVPSVEPPPPDGLAERERILEKRTQELQKLEERTASRLAMIRAEQETLERKRQEALTASAAARKAQE